MRRSGKHSRDDLSDIEQRLRGERPTLSPLTLDRVKTSAMARARSLKPKGGLSSVFAGRRRLALTGLTVGLMAAGTGSVLAAGGGDTPTGNAAVAQYGSPCIIIAGDDNTGGNNCNNTTNTVNNYYTSSTTTITMTAADTAADGEVKGFSAEDEAKESKRHIKIHLNVGHHKIKWVKVKVNGVIKSLKYGKHASPTIQIVDPPCYKGTTTVQVIGKLGNGKTVQTVHYYHLCVTSVGTVTSP